MKSRPRSNVLTRTLSVSLAAAAIGLSSGCFVVALGAAGAAGAGTVAYVRGELDASLGSDYERAIEASRRGLEQVQFVIVSEKKDAFTATLVARTAEDKKVEVYLQKAGDKLTSLRIRIGLFGDEEKSRVLLEKIQAGL